MDSLEEFTLNIQENQELIQISQYGLQYDLSPQGSKRDSNNSEEWELWDVIPMDDAQMVLNKDQQFEERQKMNAKLNEIANEASKSCNKGKLGVGLGHELIPSSSLAAPYGLQYGLSSQVAKRVADNNEELSNVVPIDDAQMVLFKEQQAFEERQKINAKLKEIANKVDTTSIMNLPPPSSFRNLKSNVTRSRGFPRQWGQPKPSHQALPYEHPSFYNRFIRSGPRYVDESLRSPATTVTARRSDLMNTRRMVGFGFENNERLTNNAAGTSFPFSFAQNRPRQEE